MIKDLSDGQTHAGACRSIRRRPLHIKFLPVKEFRSFFFTYSQRLKSLNQPHQIFLNTRCQAKPVFKWDVGFYCRVVFEHRHETRPALRQPVLILEPIPGKFYAWRLPGYQPAHNWITEGIGNGCSRNSGRFGMDERGQIHLFSTQFGNAISKTFQKSFGLSQDIDAGGICPNEQEQFVKLQERFSVAKPLATEQGKRLSNKLSVA